jgi:hypothetical protein
MSDCRFPKGVAVIESRIGDSFFLTKTVVDEAGDAVSLVGVTVECAIKDLDGVVVANLVYEPINPLNGSFEMHFPGDGLMNLPEGDYTADIQYSAPNGARTMVRSSATFYITVFEEGTP